MAKRVKAADASKRSNEELSVDRAKKMKLNKDKKYSADSSEDNPENEISANISINSFGEEGRKKLSKESAGGRKECKRF